MGDGGNREPGDDWVIAVFLLAVGILMPPALLLWAQPTHHWLAPYAIWGLLILLAAMLQLRQRHGP
jgi:hypothetical protein